jgi:sec-independent protein translocase protein TatC
MARRIAPIGHEEQLTLIDHLDELRSRLVSSLLFVALVFGFTFWQSDWVLGVITRPVDHALSTKGSTKHKASDADSVQADYQARMSAAVKALRADTADLANVTRQLQRAGGVKDPAIKAAVARLQVQIAARGRAIDRLDLDAPPIDRRPITLGVTEPFVTTMTSSLYAALLIALPFLLYQIYAFVLPAFTPRERQVALPLMFMIPVLFIGGVAFAYFLVLPQTTKFLLNFNAGEFDIQVQGREAVKFVTSFLIAIGLMFQLPVGILAVTRSGIVSVDRLRSFRGYAIVVFAVLAAVLTPTPDPGTMMLALLPLVVLYELSIILASWLDRVRPIEPATGQGALDDLAAYAPLPMDDDD